MSEKIIAIMGSLEGDLKRLAYVGNKAAGSDRLWAVYEIKNDTEFSLLAGHLTYQQARKYISASQTPQLPTTPKPTRPVPLITERNAFIIKQIQQGVPVKKLAEEQGLSRQRIAQIWRKHNPGINLRDLPRTSKNKSTRPKAENTSPT